MQNLQEWKRLENKIVNDHRTTKTDVDSLKKQTKDLEYGHQRLKGLLVNFQQKQQRGSDHGKRLQTLDEKVTANEMRLDHVEFNVNKTALATTAAKYQSQQALKTLDYELKNVSFDVQNVQFDLRRVDLAVKTLEREKRKLEQQYQQQQQQQFGNHHRQNAHQQRDEPTTDHRGSGGVSGSSDGADGGVGSSSVLARQVVDEVDRKMRRFGRRLRDELALVATNATEREMLQNERVQQQLLSARQEFLSYVGDVQGVQTSQREAIDKLERKVDAAFKMASSSSRNGGGGSGGGIIEGLAEDDEEEEEEREEEANICENFRRCVSDSDFVSNTLNNQTKEHAKRLASELAAEFKSKIDERLEASMAREAEAEARIARQREEAETRATTSLEAKARELEEELTARGSDLEAKAETWKREMEEKADQVAEELREWAEEEKSSWQKEAVRPTLAAAAAAADEAEADVENDGDGGYEMNYER